MSDSSSVLTVKLSGETKPPETIVDRQAPTIPSGMKMTARSSKSFAISWQSSSDNVKVAYYSVYLNGQKVGQTGALQYTFGKLNAASKYGVKLIAYDTAGNRSAMSAPLNVDTISEKDIVAPSVPSVLKATNVSSSGFTLWWAPAKDNVKVSGYIVYLNGKAVTKTSTTKYAFKGLSASRSYSVKLVAYDAAGNRSLMSRLLTIKTIPVKNEVR
jgi:chitodextrinase